MVFNYCELERGDYGKYGIKIRERSFRKLILLLVLIFVVIYTYNTFTYLILSSEFKN